LARLDRADHAEDDEIARGALPAPQVRVAVLGGHLVDEAVRAPGQDLRKVSRLVDLDAIAALAVRVGPRLPAREVEDAAAQRGEQAQVAAEGVETRLRVPLALDLRAVQVLELRVEPALEQAPRGALACLAQVLAAALPLDVAEQLVHARVDPDVVPVGGQHLLLEQLEVARMQPLPQL